MRDRHAPVMIPARELISRHQQRQRAKRTAHLQAFLVALSVVGICLAALYWMGH